VPYEEDIRAVTEIPDVKNGAPEKTEETEKIDPGLLITLYSLSNDSGASLR